MIIHLVPEGLYKEEKETCFTNMSKSHDTHYSGKEGKKLPKKNPGEGASIEHCSANAIPRVGLLVSCAYVESSVRLEVALRWQHRPAPGALLCSAVLES